MFIVGPLNRLGEWVPFTRGNRYETLKGVSVYGDNLQLYAGNWSIPNDPNGRVVRDSELDGFVFQLVDRDGVPYVEGLPLSRIAPGFAPLKSGVSPGPAGFNVVPMRTQLWSGGVKLVDPALTNLGVNWYVPVELFYV